MIIAPIGSTGRRGFRCGRWRSSTSAAVQTDLRRCGVAHGRAFQQRIRESHHRPRLSVGHDLVQTDGAEQLAFRVDRAVPEALVDGGAERDHLGYRLPPVIEFGGGSVHERAEPRELLVEGGPLRDVVVAVAEPELEELFRVPDGVEYDQLGQCVTGAFFPELVHDTGSWRRGNADVRRRVRPMWKAAAGAIAVLAEHRPASATKLARGSLPPGLASLIERASRAPIT